MEKFPNDILSNILIRLPAKQLAQTRCVSKPLCALLSQPGFIKSHRDYHSPHNKDDEILLVFNDRRDELSLNNDEFCMIHHSKSPNIKVTDLIKLPVNFPSMDSRYKAAGISVIGSVNGLICFYSCESSLCDPAAIHIWNPSLSALITLPPYDQPDNIVFGDEFEYFFRFGYDPKTDDYKVVKLMCDNDFAREIDNESDSSDWTQVEVYSMRNQSWKSIADERFPVHVKSIFDGNEVCIDGHDGHIHWLCSYVVDGIELLTIVGFDLFVETFSVINLPDSVRENKAGRLNSLGFLAGKLCFMSHIRNGEFEVWVMQEYGVAESWVKHCLSSHLSGTNMNPIGFTSNNKFVYYNYGTQEDYTPIALYDLDTTTVKSFNSRRNPYGNTTKFVHYVDSLVWVAN